MILFDRNLSMCARGVTATMYMKIIHTYHTFAANCRNCTFQPTSKKTEVLNYTVIFVVFVIRLIQHWLTDLDDLSIGPIEI